MVDILLAEERGSQMITIVATLSCKPGTEATILKAATDWFIPDSLKEDGCLEFILLQQKDDPTKLVSYEVFTDQAAIDEHVETGHVKRFFELITEYGVQNQFSLYDIIEVSGHE